MRQAFELAWANTYVFGKSRPFCMHMDDILFKAPVEVGQLLYFNSQICYTEDNKIQTRVSAEVVDPKANHVDINTLKNIQNHSLSVAEKGLFWVTISTCAPSDRSAVGDQRVPLHLRGEGEAAAADCAQNLSRGERLLCTASLHCILHFSR